MNTFLDMTLSMHGSETHANQTTINLLSSNNDRLVDQINTANQEHDQLTSNYVDLGNQMETSQIFSQNQTTEIANLTATIQGLRGALNMSWAETRLYMTENASLKLKCILMIGTDNRRIFGYAQ